MDPQKVGHISLKNSGGFVAQMAFQYAVTPNDLPVRTTKESGNILLGQTHTENPADLGVPNGSRVWLYVDVHAGKDTTSNESYIFEEGNSCTAHYVISGTTLNNTLALINVTCE